VVALAFVILAGCSPPVTPPTGDAAVVIDECETDAGVCPAEQRTRCRVDRLLATAQLCEVDDDCTMFTFPPNCLEYGKCPTVAVSFRRESQFSIDAVRELNAFCRATACQQPSSCTERRTPRSDCVNGRCTLIFPAADAGQGDAGP